MAVSFKETQDSEESILKILNPAVKAWFFSKFKEFSVPQRYALMEVHSRQNILVSAPTGGTKTLTGFLSILNELVDSAEKGVLQDKIYCVYISPLKALNYDIQLNLIEPLKEIEKIAGKELGIRVAVRTGDSTPAEKAAMLKHPPHILITTPESLAIVLSSTKFRDHLKNVEWCIIDEVHALAENKRGVHLSLSLERLQNLAGHMCRVGLSATVAPIEEIARFLVGSERECKIADVHFLKEMDLKVLSPVPNLIEGEHGLMHRKMYELIDDLVQKHKTTLIFTNTRSATERVVDNLKDKFPKNYTENIGAHHGSLSKELRRSIEERLRQGKLKVVVSSTSLELGIDIGYIDLVILLGSPKSVARCIQRIGRSGHRLHETSKGRIIVLDRDDLVECAVLLKSAVEKKIDRIHIPKNSLDVLAQHIHGMALEQVWDEKEMFKVIKKSYCFGGLSKKDFNDVLDYLSGEYASLEDRNVYAKIWRKEGKIGRKGKMGRVIYMTNIGTIPEESFVRVKVGEQLIGHLDEAFLERLRPGDIFVLGGNTYQFKFIRGMTVQAAASAGRPPTVPSWFSEMLPLSFDLANDIQRFRKLMEEQLKKGKSRKEVEDFISSYLYVDENSTKAIYEYFKEQFDYVGEIPNEKKIIIENYKDERGRKYAVFHTLYGRRVNDVLSRAVAYAVSRIEQRSVEIGIDDNGFFIASNISFKPVAALKMIKAAELRKVMELAIDKTEVLRRRFRHCASRSFMILRNYMGRTKNVGRQQMSSMLLLSAVRRISNDFPILKEARREVLEDLMDIENATDVVQMIQNGAIEVKEINTDIPSPFAFNLVLQGYTDILKIEDKVEFLRRMHQMVKAKIALKS